MTRRRPRRAPAPAPVALVAAEDEPVGESPEHQLERWFASQAPTPLSPAPDPLDHVTPLDDPNWTAHLPAPASSPGEPADTVEPVAPVEPVEPVVPVEPVEPVVPVESVEPVALVLPTSLVEPREAAHHPHHQATHAAAPLPPARPATVATPPPAPREDADSVGFRSGATARRLLGAAFVVATIGSVLAIFAAVDHPTGRSLLLSTALVAASLALWWAMLSWSPPVPPGRNGPVEHHRGTPPPD